MDAAASTTMAKNLNFHSTSSTHRITNLNTLIPAWSCTRANTSSLYASTKPFYIAFPAHQRTPHPSLRNIISRCSTRPNIDNDNQMDIDLNIEPKPNSNVEAEHQEEAKSSLSNTKYSISSFDSDVGLVLHLGPVNSWDSVDVGSPVVKRFLSDEKERWYMWYHGSSSENPNSDLVGLAVSSNGIHWERGRGPVNSSNDVGLVMKCSEDWWGFDTQSIRPSEVVIMSSSKVRASSAVYWLYYTGIGSEKVDIVNNSESGDEIGNVVHKSLPGLAISQDGRHWARIEGEHHTGALFDVGSENEWDSTYISSPQVVFHQSGDLRMYYHSLDAKTGHFAIGMARSRDGMKWVKLGKIMGEGQSGCFDELGVMNACVVRNRKADGKYVMAYEGVDANGRTSIGLAVSPDGLKNWKRMKDEAILKPSDGDCWDNRGVGSPCLVQMDGETDEWRLYYKGYGNERRMGIGMAFSQGSDMRRFSRWKRFHLQG